MAKKQAKTMEEDIREKTERILLKLLDEIEESDDLIVKAQVVKTVVDYLKLQTTREGEGLEEL